MSAFLLLPLSCIFLALPQHPYSWAPTCLLISDSAFKAQPLTDRRSQPVKMGGAMRIIEFNPLILQMRSQRHREARPVAQGLRASWWAPVTKPWGPILQPGFSFRYWAASLFGTQSSSCWHLFFLVFAFLWSLFTRMWIVITCRVAFLD